MALPALPLNADIRSIVERINVLIRERNGELSPVVVADLPPAAESQGMSRMVTNATLTTFQTVVAGGGANVVTVISDGVSWRIS